MKELCVLEEYCWVIVVVCLELVDVIFVILVLGWYFMVVEVGGCWVFKFLCGVEVEVVLLCEVVVLCLVCLVVSLLVLVL